MLGRIPGSTCAHRNRDHFGRNPPPRNPGPLGYNDAADLFGPCYNDKEAKSQTTRTSQ